MPRVLGAGAESQVWRKRIAGVALVALGALSCRDESPPVQMMRTALDDAPRTALVGVNVSGSGAVTVAFAAKKPAPFSPQPAGDANLRVEVLAAEGEDVLGVGEARVPPLCGCSSREAHLDGDVELPHHATVLVKVPYRKGDERLRVLRRTPEGNWTWVANGRVGGER